MTRARDRKPRESRTVDAVLDDMSSLAGLLREKTDELRDLLDLPLPGPIADPPPYPGSTTDE